MYVYKICGILKTEVKMTCCTHCIENAKHAMIHDV